MPSPNNSHKKVSRTYKPHQVTPQLKLSYESHHPRIEPTPVIPKEAQPLLISLASSPTPPSRSPCSSFSILLDVPQTCPAPFHPRTFAHAVTFHLGTLPPDLIVHDSSSFQFQLKCHVLGGCLPVQPGDNRAAPPSLPHPHPHPHLHDLQAISASCLISFSVPMTM